MEATTAKSLHLLLGLEFNDTVRRINPFGLRQ
jgi:hypothetical protein